MYTHVKIVRFVKGINKMGFFENQFQYLLSPFLYLFILLLSRQSRSRGHRLGLQVITAVLFILFIVGIVLF